MEPSDSFYTRFSGSYNRYSESKKAYLRAVDAFISQNLPKGLRIVDIGSGDGKRARAIADMRHAASLSLVDNSEGMVSLARGVPGAVVLKSDISSSPLPLDGARRYQASLCLWNVIGHIPGKKGRLAALRNIHSALEPGGFLFLDVNNRYNAAQYGVASVFKNVLKDVFSLNGSGDFRLDMEIDSTIISTVVHIFSPFEIKRLVKKAGFKVVKKENIDYRTGGRKRGIFSGQLVYMLTRP